MKAIIMAGGEGSRLRPLTATIPKPLVPVMDKPVMEHIINLLKVHGFYHIGATLQYLPHKIQDYFEHGENHDVRISYFTENTPLGTAGSVKNAESMLDGTFLVISGDALTDIDLTALIAAHREKNAAVTIALKKVAVPLDYGVVITDKNGRIKKFLEKPSWSQVFSNLANTGIYVIERELLSKIPPATFFDFSKDLFPLLLKQDIPIYGWLTENYWCDIGNLDQYMRSHYDILADKVALSGISLLKNGIWISPHAHVAADALLEAPVYIGAGARVCAGARINESVLGESVLVSSGASVKRSVLWRNCLVGENTQLRGCVCGHGVVVKKHAAIFESVAIGDHSIIGEYATVDKASKIWPEKQVEKLGHLSGNLIWTNKYENRIFGAKGIAGEYLLDISPELMLSLGMAYAGAKSTNSGKKLLVAVSGGAAAKVLKTSLTAGLLAGGMDACDGYEMSLPACRYAVWSQDMAGGIYIQTDGENVSVHFVESDGAYISAEAERKTENLLRRGDFTPLQSVNVGTGCASLWIGDEYLVSLKKLLPYNDSEFRVVVACNNAVIIRYLEDIFETLNGELLSLRVSDGDLSEIADKIKCKQALFGVYIEADGESCMFFDEDGVPADESFLGYFLEKSEGFGESCPAHFSSCHNFFTARLSHAMKAVPFGDEKAYWRANIPYDGIAALTAVLVQLLTQGKAFSELAVLTQRLYTSESEIFCPWDMKGELMRWLIEDASLSGDELTDGFELKDDRGHVLVLPDSSEPVFKVFAEAYDMEAASELTDFYRQKLADYLHKHK